MTDNFDLKVFMRNQNRDKIRYNKEENLMALHDKCFPRCITHEQWKLWRATRPSAGVAGLCEDCTPEYQNKMCLTGKCDHPEILFYVDKDGLLFGSLTPRIAEVALNIKFSKGVM